MIDAGTVMWMAGALLVAGFVGWWAGGVVAAGVAVGVVMIVEGVFADWMGASRRGVS